MPIQLGVMLDEYFKFFLKKISGINHGYIEWEDGWGWGEEEITL